MFWWIVEIEQNKQQQQLLRRWTRPSINKWEPYEHKNTELISRGYATIHFAPYAHLFPRINNKLRHFNQQLWSALKPWQLLGMLLPQRARCIYRESRSRIWEYRNRDWEREKWIEIKTANSTWLTDGNLSLSSIELAQSNINYTITVNKIKNIWKTNERKKKRSRTDKQYEKWTSMQSTGN